MATTSATPVDDARRDVRLVGILLLSLIVITYLPLPFRLAGIAFGLLTIVLSIRGLHRQGKVRRAGGKPQGQIALSVGLGLASVVTMLTMTDAVIYPIAAERERCLAGAVTRTASELCEARHRERLEDLLEPLRQRTGMTP